MALIEITATPIAGVLVAQRKPVSDDRGFFGRFYCAEEFRAAGIHAPVAQINHSFTKAKGAGRGLHFQRPPHDETKLVSCLSGSVFDVAVDLRKNSPTFLKWHSEILSASNFRSLLIPPGCAHGFQTLEENCELIYLHTAAYNPDAEDLVHLADPAFGVSWPLPLTNLSERDRAQEFIGDNFDGISL